MKKILLAVLVVAICGSGVVCFAEHPTAAPKAEVKADAIGLGAVCPVPDTKAGEDAVADHPKGEHPNTEHPVSEPPKAEHPAPEHPTPDHPK